MYSCLIHPLARPPVPYLSSHALDASTWTRVTSLRQVFMVALWDCLHLIFSSTVVESFRERLDMGLLLFYFHHKFMV